MSRVKHLPAKRRNPVEVILLDVNGHSARTRLVLNSGQAGRLAKALLWALQQQRSARPTA